MKDSRSKPGALASWAAAVACLVVAGCSLNPPLRLSEVRGLGAAVELVDVPFHPQQANHCGPASLLTVLEYSGVVTDYESLVERVYVPGLGGSLQAEMTATARELGRVAYVLPPEEEAVLGEVAVGRPVLVLLNLGVPSSPRWHYAVMVGFDVGKNQLVLRSGLESRRVVKPSAWLRRWDWAGRWAMVLLRPGEWPVGADRGRLLQALADFEEVGPAESVEQAWARALEAWPDDSIAWLGLGNATYARGDLARAEVAYRRALELDSPSLPARLNLAMVLADSGRACDALRLLGSPPEADHLLATTFRDLSKRLERACVDGSSLP